MSLEGTGRNENCLHSCSFSLVCILSCIWLEQRHLKVSSQCLLSQTFSPLRVMSCVWRHSGDLEICPGHTTSLHIPNTRWICVTWQICGGYLLNANIWIFETKINSYKDWYQCIMHYVSVLYSIIDMEVLQDGNFCKCKIDIQCFPDTCVGISITLPLMNATV
jgi:hypothetical protein